MPSSLPCFPASRGLSSTGQAGHTGRGTPVPRVQSSLPALPAAASWGSRESFSYGGMFLVIIAKGFYHRALSQAPCAKDSGSPWGQSRQSFRKSTAAARHIPERTQNWEPVTGKLGQERQRQSGSGLPAQVSAVSTCLVRKLVRHPPLPAYMSSAVCASVLYKEGRKNGREGKEERERQRQTEKKKEKTEGTWWLFFLIFWTLSFYISLPKRVEIERGIHTLSCLQVEYHLCKMLGPRSVSEFSFSDRGAFT